MIVIFEIVMKRLFTEAESNSTRNSVGETFTNYIQSNPDVQAKLSVDTSSIGVTGKTDCYYSEIWLSLYLKTKL